MKKTVKAWYVDLAGFPEKMRNFSGCGHFRAYRTRASAKEHWPDIKAIPCTITFTLPTIKSKK